MSSSVDGGDTIRVSRLDGGLRVVTETLPQSRSVAVGAWVGVGNRDEPAAIAGVSHFLEHLLFKGSSTRSAQDIAQGIDAVGGDLNAFTSKEYTAFHARVPAWELDFGLDTLLDVLADPGFSDAELEAERQVILEELAWSADTPDDVVHGVLAENLSPATRLAGRCWERPSRFGRSPRRCSSLPRSVVPPAQHGGGRRRPDRSRRHRRPG